VEEVERVRKKGWGGGVRRRLFFYRKGYRGGKSGLQVEKGGGLGRLRLLGREERSLDRGFSKGGGHDRNPERKIGVVDWGKGSKSMGADEACPGRK